jgi:Mg-chelatase subunit ChlD
VNILDAGRMQFGGGLMRQVSFGLGLLCWFAMSACSSGDDKKVASPANDFNNPLNTLLAGRTGSGSGGAQANANRCVEGRANTSRVTPRVIFVADGSCSMSTNYPANGAQSASECKENPNGRWAALRKALLDPQNGVVPKLQSIVKFGIAVFGTQPTCPIPGEPVRPALNNLTMIDAKMPPVQPGMYTPTGPALDWVYDNLIDPAQADADNGPQIVILATDGEPNSCGGQGTGGRNGMQQVTTNYQPSIDAVKKGTGKGVTTYVISLADSAGAFHDHLQELANLGNPSANGAAKLYAPASPEQLEADLQQLVGGAVGCDIALNGMIAAGTECSGTVTLSGAAIGCNQPDGWKLVDGRHIRLQGAACKMLMEKNAAVEARFPCSSFSPD